MVRLEKAEEDGYGPYYTVWKDVSDFVEFRAIDGRREDEHDPFQYRNNATAAIPELVHELVPAGYRSISSNVYSYMVATEGEVDERESPTLSWPFWHTTFWNSPSVLERFERGATASDESSLWGNAAVFDLYWYHNASVLVRIASDPPVPENGTLTINDYQVT